MKHEYLFKDSVMFEGVELKLDDTPIKPGDLYLAERNTGPKLLTCREVSSQFQCIHPIEIGYSFDTWECRKVVAVDGRLV